MFTIREEFRKAHPDISEMLMTDKYDFLRTNEHLGDRIILLGLGGSFAYGLNNAHSDTDIRGIALNSRSDLLGLSHFESFVNTDTDTTIYSVNKYVSLLMDANPNIVELLGNNPSDYIYISPLGQLLLDNAKLFLSQKVYYSFGGYAYAQLKRIQNATARDSLPEEEREKHIKHSIEKQLEANRQFFAKSKMDLKLEVADAVTEGHSKEILMSGEFHNYPLRAFNQVYNMMNQVCKDYDHLDNRNRKKDELHLNKHASHLIRLYDMAIEILRDGEVNTKRTGENRELLLNIKNGKYMEDGILNQEFYDLLDARQVELENAFKSTSLPKKPDFRAAEELLMRINEEGLKL